MPKEQQYKTNVTALSSSKLHTDTDPLNQPKNTHRFALNIVNESIDGQHTFLSNERSTHAFTNRPDGYDIIGDRYIEDDTSFLILVNPTTGQEELGLIEKNNIYRTIVNTNVLGLLITNQCQIVYRLRRGNEKVVYWVDGFNKARSFNLSREHNFYNVGYRAYLQAGGDPALFLGEKWEAASFDLNKSYSIIPFFSNIEQVESGNALPGSYSFAIQYVDEDLNPTEWITTTNTTNVYNDSTNNPYHKIRGSRNINTDSQNFPRTNKAIKLTLSNLDDSFPYYRIAIIRAAGNTGQPEKVYASSLYPTSDGNFIYNGNDSELVEISLLDILIDKEIIFAPQHIEQIENRLLLANTKGKGINWCEFQKFASKISSDLVTKEVLLNNILSEPNVKHAKSTFLYRGYMPGEVYSFGIVYIFDDGTTSPAFHIPGKNITNVTSKMKYYEVTTNYLDIHNCSADNYWGLDATGSTLIAKKIRHHRFPFRKEVNKPLYGSTGTATTINKYRLRATVTLNPAWTPGPIEYPVDGSGNPIVIPYTFNYEILGSLLTDSYSGQLVDTDIGTVITIYDDITQLDNSSFVNYGELEASSTLAVTYQVPGNERFIIVFTYDTYVASTSFNNDKSEIFGIEFSNIERPQADIVGFYIVRNERTDDDRLILDNAIFGPMTQFQNYKSFGLIMPKQFYYVDNCGRQSTPVKTVSYFDKGAWFFNPEFQYFGKKTEYDRIEIEGTYSETSVNMPTISNFDGSTCNGGPGLTLFSAAGGSRGVYIDDVQAGTSYNPAVNKGKNKDDDGFDLIIGYRNTNISYSINTTTILPAKKRVLYFNAASYQNFDGNIYYNTSVDNKIGMYTSDAVLNTNIFYDPATKKNHLLYGSLVKNNTTAYSNFITRTYYKEHNNPILFGGSNILNNVKVFNGDAQISAMNFVSTVFYDMIVANRPKKNSLWKIVTGAILLIAGIALAIPSGGASLGLTAAAASALSTLVISYGISLAMTGIKFEQFKSMIDTEYEKGLKETVIDGGVYETVRETIDRRDDTIRWFADRVSNIYIESSVPFGLRSGLTTGVSDFIDAPAPYDELEFRSYLTEKLTTIDREQGSGRMYKGYAGAEVYDMNKDYMRFNKEKNFIHLPIEYDCCSDNNEVFPMRVWYSQQSFQEEKIDNYRVFLPNNYRDVEGEHGEITNLYKLGNSLFIHTKEALWHLPQNIQERITDEIVSFIGTGQFFNIMPRKVVDDNLGSAGTQHKWATVKTKNGVIFVNEIEGKIYLHADKLKDISSIGRKSWFENNLKSSLSKQLYDKLGVNYLHDNNPANKNGVGYISAYDTRYERVLITKRDYLILPAKLALLSIIHTAPIAGTEFTYSTLDGLFYFGTTQIVFANQNYFEDKSWTISFSFYNSGWISMHSYMPNYYIHSQNNLYSALANGSDTGIHKHNIDESFQTFYDIFHPCIIELVKISPLSTEVLEYITLQTKARRWNGTIKDYIDEHFITFNKITAYNSRQNTGEVIMTVKDTQANPQNWYSQQLVNIPGGILITRKERDWYINEFRDNIIDYTQPMFSTAWNDIKSAYYIDKVINPAVISFAKPWEQLQSLRDKYIVIRLKFDTFNDVNLILNYSLETEQSSTR